MYYFTKNYKYHFNSWLILHSKLFKIQQMILNIFVIKNKFLYLYSMYESRNIYNIELYIKELLKSINLLIYNFKWKRVVRGQNI